VERWHQIKGIKQGELLLSSVFKTLSALFTISCLIVAPLYLAHKRLSPLVSMALEQILEQSSEKFSSFSFTFPLEEISFTSFPLKFPILLPNTIKVLTSSSLYFTFPPC
jgi:hypothetical protein